MSAISQLIIVVIALLIETSHCWHNVLLMCPYINISEISKQPHTANKIGENAHIKTHCTYKMQIAT